MAGYFPETPATVLPSSTVVASPLSQTPEPQTTASHGALLNPSATSSTSSSRTSTSSSSTARTGPAFDDPLTRTYPAPTEEVSLDELLARKPRKWTLGHYISQTPTGELAPMLTPSPPLTENDAKQRVAKAEAFAKAKAELLAAQASMGKVVLKKL